MLVFQERPNGRYFVRTYGVDVGVHCALRDDLPKNARAYFSPRGWHVEPEWVEEAARRLSAIQTVSIESAKPKRRPHSDPLQFAEERNAEIVSDGGEE